ncbi:MAG: NFACT family protein [Lachnospiraceae bacterium]|nr:NFACT family protein [Lachnospiraceae bacterium]
MAFDGIVIANLVHEFQKELLNGRIAKIAQPETDELLLTIKGPHGQRRLSISANASLPLIYLTQNNKPSPMTAPNFCMLLRKHIGSGRIIQIEQPKLERIIDFTIEHRNDLGDLCQKKLIVEIMGKHSNIIFCENNGNIVDSIKHISSHTSSVREVLPGRRYFIPDTMKKQDPLSIQPKDFIPTLMEKSLPLAKSIYTTFTGVSPIVAEEICYLAGIDSNVSFQELSEDIKAHIWNQFQIFFGNVTKHNFQPTIYYQDTIPTEFSALPLSHFSGYETKTFTSPSQMAETYYATKSIVTRIRQKSTDLRQVVQRAQARNRKKYDLQLKQLKDTESQDKNRIYGELINTYGYHLEPGAKHLEAENYYDDNKIINIPLDPQKTPQENANRYFEKYNKQKRTFQALSQLIEETKDEIVYLDSINNALEIATTEEDLAEIKEELTRAAYMRRKFTKKKETIKSKPLHYISGDGYHMYVGKNNLQNDQLTFGFATGNDWWFHAKGAPGSHVILKIHNNNKVPNRTFEEAGKLAAYYSALRGNEKAEIDYAEKKHIKKPKGGKPGFVIYHSNYSLVIDSDIRNITQIF